MFTIGVPSACGDMTMPSPGRISLQSAPKIGNACWGEIAGTQMRVNAADRMGERWWHQLQSGRAHTRGAPLPEVIQWFKTMTTV